MPGVKAVVSHENCAFVWGAGSVAGGRQYVEEVKKITKQRRYAFNNPVATRASPSQQWRPSTGTQPKKRCGTSR